MVITTYTISVAYIIRKIIFILFVFSYCTRIRRIYLYIHYIHTYCTIIFIYFYLGKEKDTKTLERFFYCNYKSVVMCIHINFLFWTEILYLSMFNAFFQNRLLGWLNLSSVYSWNKFHAKLKFSWKRTLTTRGKIFVWMTAFEPIIIPQHLPKFKIP